MADTWENIVHDAIVEIGAKSDGEDLTADELNGGLRRLRGMLDQWTQDGLLIPYHKTLTHTTENSTDIDDKFTFGARGSLPEGNDPDVIVNFPIEEIDYLLYHRSGRQNDMPLRRQTLVVLQHNHSVNSNYPTMWHFERDFPVAQLYFNTPTDTGDSFTLHYTTVLETESIVGSGEISDIFPPGYREAVVLNLAVKLAPSYGVTEGRASGLSAATLRGAMDAKKLIRKRHVQVSTSIIDRSLLTRKYNMIRGSRYHSGHY
ncbi:MAG: hypothetical protein OXD01_12830 [Gammaproteobacteria bacterium]|nr:hypothetical protein [Gammaproteobacteria bacterium]